MIFMNAANRNILANMESGQAGAVLRQVTKFIAISDIEKLKQLFSQLKSKLLNLSTILSEDILKKIDNNDFESRNMSVLKSMFLHMPRTADSFLLSIFSLHFCIFFLEKDRSIIQLLDTLN